MERVHTVPLRDAWKVSVWKRSRKAMSVIKAFAARHAKVEIVKVGQELNHTIWSRGSKNPPRKLKIQLVTDDKAEKPTVWVELADVKFTIPGREEEKKTSASKKEPAKKEAKKDDKKEEKPKKADKKAEPKKEEKKVEVSTSDEAPKKEEKKEEPAKEAKPEEKKEEPKAEAKEESKVEEKTSVSDEKE